MKTKRMLLRLIAVCCLLAIFSVDAAAAVWVTCTIDEVGPYGLTEDIDGTYIYLTDTAVPPAWEGSRKIFISPKRGKEYLAAALTALANDKKVKVYLRTEAVTPTILGLYILK